MHLQQSDDVDAFQVDYIRVESPIIVRQSKDSPLRPYSSLIILSVCLNFCDSASFVRLLPPASFSSLVLHSLQAAWWNGSHCSPQNYNAVIAK